MSTNPPPIDSQISPATSLAYWESIASDNNGMLGGYEAVTDSDLKASKIFFTQVQRILGNTSPQSTSTSKSTSSSSSTKTPPPPLITHAVDCGAGIGRITRGLLLKISSHVDAVEPIAKFAAEISNLKTESEEGARVDEVFVQGLEDWSPPLGKRYDLVWNQWCLGHLTDVQLVEYLRRVAKGLSGCHNGTGADEGSSVMKGWIMVKENITHRDDTDGKDDDEDSEEDLFDEQDSSVTRTNKKFRRIFEQAGLIVIRAQRQKNFPGELYPVMMYALRPRG